ncbi:hypothetical protein [Parasphingorhabdus sp.]|uniref:hypothetical protein n=1 Tax=Parasphingorhabdus sp. TaxID=2709688 RepID=UPI00300188CD
MSDLFSDLYRYRERERKNNYEDWLTECLAAILRSLPAEIFANFTSRLTGQSADAIAEIHPYISIATQVTIEREDLGLQRPDLIISIAAPKQEEKREPSQPWLLFENKIAHHVDEQELETGDVESQLHRYGRWLQKQKFSRLGLKQSLIFVTHRTPVPTDFPERANTLTPSPYGDLGRNPCTWGKIADMLKEVSKDCDDRLHFCALITAYQSFLEDHSMDDAYPEYRDFAALAGFVEIVQPFSKLVNEMIGKLDGLAPFYGRVVWAAAHEEEGTYSAFRYLAKDDRYDEHTYLATGIWFPDRGEGLYSEEIENKTGRPISFAPKVYIQFANDVDGELTAIKGTPEGDWYRINSDFFIFRDVSSFLPEPGDRAREILAWVETEGAKLKAILAS